ncbi:MAG: sigma-70 family RNA polymerase sigma factor [Planctomycetota bacterium]|nr:sigma-70 family RNA polymerase sigma factor [Planctomycetota bacterium]
MAEQPDLNQTLRDLSLAQDGDSEAAERLWARYYDKLVPAVRIRLGQKLRSKVETLDIVQNVFLEAVSSASEKDFKSQGHFRAWLNRLVENRIRKSARDFGRQKRDTSKERPLMNTTGEERTTIRHDAPRPVSIVEEFDELERMEKSMELLPQEVRELLVMRFFDEMTYGEIGEVLNRTEEAARKAVNRAIEMLSKTMK